MKRLLTTLVLGLAAAAGAYAQAWPSKPVTLVVPFPPGGSTDSIARAIGPSLTKTFGQTFVVDNKPGATGTIGAGAVKRAPADGYTFLVTSLGPLVIAPHLIKSMPYDALKDFDLITVAVQAPNVLVVPAALGDAQVKSQFAAIGVEVVANTPEQFAAFQQQEFARWKNLIEVRKITAD